MELLIAFHKIIFLYHYFLIRLIRYFAKLKKKASETFLEIELLKLEHPNFSHSSKSI